MLKHPLSQLGLNTRAVLLALLYVAPHCASQQRPQGSRIEVDGRYVYAGDKSRGCHGQVHSTQRHHQAAGSAALTHVGRDGVRGGARATLFAGVPNSHEGFDNEVDLSPYMLGAASGRIGFGSRFVAVEGGATMLFPTIADLVVIPGGGVLVGDLDVGWFELGVFHPDHIHDGEILALGGGFRIDRTEARITLGLFARPMRALQGDTRLGGWDGIFDAAAHVDVRFAVDERLGLTMGAVLGVQPSFNIGISWLLPGG